MEQRFETIGPKKLIGKCLRMSMANNKTGELWKSFMPQRSQITNAIGTDLYSLQVLPPHFYTRFNPTTEFEKWALAEVSNFKTIPEGMHTFELPGGLYAVFLYKGPVSEGAKAFDYIIRTWMPESGYTIDDRPQFEVLGANYKNNDPNSEEEIWIPVKKSAMRSEV